MNLTADEKNNNHVIKTKQHDMTNLMKLNESPK